MKRWKRALVAILIGPAVVYATQVVIVVYWQVIPIAQAGYEERVYTIRHGFGGGMDFVPLIGLIPVSGEPVRLTIEEKSTGEQTSRAYDLAVDVFKDYPEVFPGKQGT